MPHRILTILTILMTILTLPVIQLFIQLFHSKAYLEAQHQMEWNGVANGAVLLANGCSSDAQYQGGLNTQQHSTVICIRHSITLFLVQLQNGPIGGRLELIEFKC